MTMKADPIPFLTLVKDAADRLSGLHDDILSGEIDENDIGATRDDLAAWCDDIGATLRAMYLRIAEKQAEEHFRRNPDPYSGLRHSQYERL